MDKLGDIDLFVAIVKHQGLAIAGREVGLSPASMTARLNRLEAHYGVRLLNRTTRRISLTEEGEKFYHSCLRIQAEVSQAEERLYSGREVLSGRLRITATYDLGQSQIAPLLADFVEQHSKVSVYLHLSDSLEKLVENQFDLAVRYGGMSDSQLVSRRLAANHRMLCASPAYLAKFGMPQTPEDLKNHRCLSMKREGASMSTWHFSRANVHIAQQIDSTMSSSNGAQIHEWAVLGMGIALKSYWDIKSDLEANRLLPVLADYDHSFDAGNPRGMADLNVMYPSREYLPERTREFINILVNHFSE